MIPDLVIFDCDGVIVDSEGPTSDVIASSLTRYGWPISGAESHEIFVGGTLQQVMAKGRAKGADLPDNWITEVYDEMYALLEQGVPLSAGVVDLFDALEAQGTRIAIASNGAMTKMRTTLGPYGLFDRFDGRIYSGHVDEPKPGGGMLVKAMAQANAAPERTFMIDDSPAGAGAAQSASTRFYGYVEHGNRKKMEPLGVDLVSSMAELSKHLIK